MEDTRLSPSPRAHDTLLLLWRKQCKNGPFALVPCGGRNDPLTCNNSIHGERFSCTPVGYTLYARTDGQARKNTTITCSNGTQARCLIAFSSPFFGKPLLSFITTCFDEKTKDEATHRSSSDPLETICNKRQKGVLQARPPTSMLQLDRFLVKVKVL